MHTRLARLNGLLFASLATFPAFGAELALLRAKDPANYSVSVPPGQLFTFNFVATAGGSRVAATFESNQSAVVASAIVHPRSDIRVDGDQLVVDCPGIERHQLEVASMPEPVDKGTIHSNPTEPGIFGFAFWNLGPAEAVLKVSIVSDRPIMIGFVGLRGGDVVPLSRKQPPSSKK